MGWVWSVNLEAAFKTRLCRAHPPRRTPTTQPELLHTAVPHIGFCETNRYVWWDDILTCRPTNDALGRCPNVACCLTLRRIMLQNQTDRLFLALEKRAAAQKSREESGDGVSFEIGTNVDRGFKIHVVGDSTMRVSDVPFFF